MNLIEVMERFPDQESCIEYLERIRWRGACTAYGFLGHSLKQDCATIQSY